MGSAGLPRRRSCLSPLATAYVLAHEYGHLFQHLTGTRVGPRRVNVETMYDLERFRPQYHSRLGRPLLLGSTVGESVAVG